MNDQTIVCPQCKASIKLTESLAAPMIEAVKQQYAQAMAKKDEDIRRREEAVREQQQSIDEQLAARLKDERAKITQDEARKAKLAVAAESDKQKQEIVDLYKIIGDSNAKLAAAQKDQAEALKKQRECDDIKRELELKIEQRVKESLQKERATGKKEAEEALNLRLTEKEQKINSLTAQIDELKRRAEQGSQQAQGDAQEVQLEALLKDQFPADRIERVAKGEHGGDVVQRVVNAHGKLCGSLLWESKRTKSWSDGWLAKLRDDQRAAGADLAVLVSQSLPKEIESFALKEGIWVTAYGCLLPVAAALRQTLLSISDVRQSNEGRQTKMELVYEYLTGPSFRQRVEAIVEKFTDMRLDLDKERKFVHKQWAKREKQINSVIANTLGLHGDLQGIAGQSIQEIEGFDVKLLNDSAKTPDEDDE